MANPAELLLRQLQAWRGDQNNPNRDDQRIATRHIESIDELLNQMDGAGLKTDLFRRHFGRWVELTYGHPHTWQPPGSGTSTIPP
jgi:hypothetical protein